MGNKRKNKKAISTATTTINNNIELDYDKLAEAIVRANKRIKEQDELVVKENDDISRKEWQKIIGYKEYAKSESRLKRKVHKFRNGFSILWHMITFKEKNAKYDVATFGLLQLATVIVFNICKWLLYLLSLLILIMSFFTLQDKVFVFNFRPFLLFYFIPTFLFSRLFRMAAFEINHITDRNYLISILSATTCFFAMIVAIIALFKG